MEQEVLQRVARLSPSKRALLEARARRWAEQRSLPIFELEWIPATPERDSGAPRPSDDWELIADAGGLAPHLAAVARGRGQRPASPGTRNTAATRRGTAR